MGATCMLPSVASLTGRAVYLIDISLILIICLNLFQLLKVGHHRLVLRDVDLKSTGTYTCQITLSGPPFHTEQRDKNLTVISK